MKQTHIVAWIIGGLITGVGVRMGNGCTSGHGVCGMPRFSLRSITATCTFMATGFALASLKFHEPFLNNGDTFASPAPEVWRWLTLAIMCLANLCGLAIFFRSTTSPSNRLDYVWTYVFGLLFGLGLLISGMCRISKILNFLIIDSERWDCTLAFVMLSAVCINVFTFHYILKRNYPMYGEKFCAPNPRQKPDFKLIGGAALFGVGWGFAGLCPGPGIINFFALTHGLFWLASLILGMLSYDYTSKYLEDKKKN